MAAGIKTIIALSFVRKDPKITPIDCRATLGKAY
jgi:hypothetical protein